MPINTPSPLSRSLPPPFPAGQASEAERGVFSHCFTVTICSLALGYNMWWVHLLLPSDFSVFDISALGRAVPNDIFACSPTHALSNSLAPLLSLRGRDGLCSTRADNFELCKNPIVGRQHEA